MKKILIILLLALPLALFGQLDTVNIGSSANSGTGESLRAAFIKTNRHIKAYNAAYLYRLSLSGAHTVAFTTTGNTALTLPTSGTLATNPMTAAGDLIIGGASGVPTRLAAGITGSEVMTTESLTDAVINHVGDTTVTALVGRIVFKTSDGHFYGCKATSGHKWFQLDN